MDRNEIIKQAILNEIDGYEFYKMYAKQASSIEMREQFMLTANEELTHIDFLKKLLNGKSGDYADLRDIDVPQPGIFKDPELKPDEVNTAMAAYNIGVMMEEKSAKFYREHAENSDDEGIKKLFNVLALWEENHRDAFLKKYEQLKENFWDENRFSPF